MWVFTDVANWFDKERASNARFLENAANNTDDDFLGALAWTGIGIVRILNTGAGGFAGGFVDVLRIGDGVKEGGWGYGKDALRALAVIGPALRVGRYALGLVAAVDATPSVGNCAWVAASRAARMTGTQHFATVGSLAKAFGLAAEETGELGLRGVQQIIQQLGGEARLLPSVSSFQEVEAIARSNPDGLVIFPVRFMRAVGLGQPGGPSVQALIDNGHALIAKSVGGVVFIVDRSGKVYRSLDELAKVYGAEQALGMTIHAQAGILVVKNSRVIGGMNFVSQASSIMNVIAYEMRVVPNPLYNGGQGSNIVTLMSDEQKLAGWWYVWVGSWFWTYVFEQNGNVRWTDPYNHQTGTGKWTNTGGAITVKWAAPSTTIEDWTFPLNANDQKGTCHLKSGDLDLKAVKIGSATNGVIQNIVGRWKVNVSNWTWNYDFDVGGRVKWTDPFNGMSGTGQWTITKTGLYTWWTPGSRTTEEWTGQLDASSLDGTAKMQTGTFPLHAEKN